MTVLQDKITPEEDDAFDAVVYGYGQPAEPDWWWLEQDLLDQIERDREYAKSAAFLALQAHRLEEALGLVDTGALMARRRGIGGDGAERRPTVEAAEADRKARLVDRVCWSLHSSGLCSGRGVLPAWPPHDYTAHQLDAEAAVRTTHPPAYEFPREDR